MRDAALDDRRRIEISCTSRGRELAQAARERKEVFHTWLRDRLDGRDLSSTLDVLGAFLDDSPLGETVRQRRTRTLAAEGQE